MADIVNLANRRLKADGLLAEHCGTCGHNLWHLLSDGRVMCGKCACVTDRARWRWEEPPLDEDMTEE